MTSPVGRLVSAHGVIAFGITEKIDTGHVDVVGGGDVTGPAAAVNDIRTGSREKIFGMGNALHGIRANFRLSAAAPSQPWVLIAALAIIWNLLGETR